MSTLYELTGEYLQLMEMLEYPQEGEEDILADTMEAIGGEIEIKAENYAKVIRMVEADISTLDGEIKRLQERKAALSNNIVRMKNALQKSMEATGQTSIRTPLFSLNIQKNPPSVVIDDESKVPGQYLIPQPPKIDKKGMVEALKGKPSTVYAHLEQTSSLRIR